jgi:hypothetical protein
MVATGSDFIATTSLVQGRYDYPANPYIQTDSVLHLLDPMMREKETATLCSLRQATCTVGNISFRQDARRGNFNMQRSAYSPVVHSGRRRIGADVVEFSRTHGLQCSILTGMKDTAPDVIFLSHGCRSHYTQKHDQHLGFDRRCYIFQVKHDQRYYTFQVTEVHKTAKLQLWFPYKHTISEFRV